MRIKHAKQAMITALNATWLNAMGQELNGVFDGSARVNVLLLSAAGFGKTTICRQVFDTAATWLAPELRAAGFNSCSVVERNDTVDRPEDIGGIPDYTHEIGHPERVAIKRGFEDLEALATATSPTVCLMDDKYMGTSKSMQAASLKLCRGVLPNNRRVSPWVAFVATSNHKGDGYNTGVATPDITSWHMVIELEQDIESILTYFREEIDAHPAVVSFLDIHPDYIQDLPESKRGPMEKSLNSRTWHMCSDNLYRFERSGITDAECERAYVESSLPAYAVDPFMAHLRMFKLTPDIADVFTNPNEASIPDNVSQRYAQAVMIAALVAKERDKDKARSALVYAKRLGDFQSLVIDAIDRKAPGFLEGIASTLYQQYMSEKAAEGIMT